MFDFDRKNADILKEKKLWLFDMDGTIYMGNTIFPGTLPLLNSLLENGQAYMFLTNNASKSVDAYVEKVRKMGIMADRDTFFTSVNATIGYLKANFPGALIYAQGTRSFIEQLRAADIRVTEDVTEEAAVVLVGFDTELTFHKLEKTCEMLTRFDRPYIATNLDFVCPVEGGFVPDCGSMCFGIEKATGKYPAVIGKPEPTMIYEACKARNAALSDVVLLGDRLYTDIASGVNAGVTTICVLSGEAALPEIRAYEKQPDFIFNSVQEIFEGLTE